MGVPSTHFCVRCGRGESEVTFRSTRAMNCNECLKDAENERRVYNTMYRRASTRALYHLKDEYTDEYQRLMDEEWLIVQREERAKKEGSQQ